MPKPKKMSQEVILFSITLPLKALMNFFNSMREPLSRYNSIASVVTSIYLHYVIKTIA